MNAFATNTTRTVRNEKTSSTCSPLARLCTFSSSLLAAFTFYCASVYRKKIRVLSCWHECSLVCSLSCSPIAGWLNKYVKYFNGVIVFFFARTIHVVQFTMNGKFIAVFPYHRAHRCFSLSFGLFLDSLSAVCTGLIETLFLIGLPIGIDHGHRYSIIFAEMNVSEVEDKMCVCVCRYPNWALECSKLAITFRAMYNINVSTAHWIYDIRFALRWFKHFFHWIFQEARSASTRLWIWMNVGVNHTYHLVSTVNTMLQSLPKKKTCKNRDRTLPCGLARRYLWDSMPRGRTHFEFYGIFGLSTGSETVSGRIFGIFCWFFRIPELEHGKSEKFSHIGWWIPILESNKNAVLCLQCTLYGTVKDCWKGVPVKPEHSSGLG